MIARLKALVLMQLGEKMNIKAFHNRGEFIKQVLFKALGVVLLAGVVFMLFFILENLLRIKVDKNVLIFILSIMQGISIIAATGGLSDTMYRSNDNDFLFSLPAKHNEVFVSKMAVFYVYELLRNISFLLPFLIAFGLFSSVWWGYFLFIPFSLILLSLLPVLIGVLISIPYTFIYKFLKERPFLSGALAIAFTVAIFNEIGNLIAKLPSELRFVAMYNRIYTSINGFISNVVENSLYYINIGNILVNERILIDLIIIAGLVSILFALAYFVSRPIYFKMAISSQESKKRKKKIKKESKKLKPFVSYVFKEFKLLTRSTTQLVGGFAYLLILPFVLYFLNTVISTFDVRDFGRHMLIAFNIFLGLLILLSSNTYSATAFSKEGDRAYLLKTAPVCIMRQAVAKVVFNIIISVFVITLSSIAIAITTDISGHDMFFMFLLFVIITIGHIIWSIDIDFMDPDFNAFEQDEGTSDNKNVSMSIKIGIIIAVIVGFISFSSFSFDYDTAWIKVISIALVFLASRIYLFINKVNVYFKELEI